MQSRSQAALIIFALAATIVCSLALVANQKKPQYQGRSLSEWLDMAGTHVTNTHQQARTAVLAMTSNAVPILLQWISYETPRWRANLARRVFPRRTWSIDLVQHLIGYAAADDSCRALEGFCILGTNAASAIPELMTISRNTNSFNAAFRAINALSLIGQPAYPYMVAGLNDTNHPYRWVFARDFPILAELIGTNACRPALARMLQDPDPQIRITVRDALAEIDPPPLTNNPTVY